MLGFPFYHEEELVPHPTSKGGYHPLLPTAAYSVSQMYFIVKYKQFNMLFI
jgi:hypothetical protein